MSVVPNSYEAWKHCITVDCGIPLTKKFVSERIESLDDGNNFHTQQFVKSWGGAHHAQTLALFRRAKEELEASQ